MTKKILIKGNDAIGAAAIAAQCDAYFGYPITPQNELTAYMSKFMLDEKRVFVQAEAEVSAINMVFGASAAGKRVMTSSSSPGISLKQEGISYIAGARLPCVIVNMQRGGPGLGNIRASQSDYFQATKGGGHGDYKLIVLAPSTVQECYDYTMMAFDYSDKYRVPAMILGDGIVGQMMEPIELKPYKKPKLPAKDWAVTGKEGRKMNLVRSLYLHPAPALKDHNIVLQDTYKKMKQEITQHEEIETEDAELIVVSWGITARIAKSAIKLARKDGIKVGMIRPITLFPFPEKAISKIAQKDSTKQFLVMEMNFGQMLEDVKLAVNGKKPVKFYGWGGGWYPTPEELYEEIKRQ